MLATFVTEVKDKFSLRVTENKLTIFFLIQVHGPPEMYALASKGSWTPG
jgi:hypothetical protein